MKTYDFKEFIRNEHLENIKKPTLSLVPLAVAPLTHTMTAHAAEQSMQAKMISAFDPIIDLVQSLAYPVAMVTVLAGGIALMVGNREKAFSLMTSAGIGYVVVMIAPMILDVLVSAMKTVV